MWDRDFLDKWDMARRIEARLFCFGSGDSDDSSSDSGGSDPAPDDTQANYEQEAFGGPRNQTDGVNFRQAPAQPVSDSDPADRIANVVGLNTTLLDMARSAPADVRAANSAANDAIFNEFIANDMINQQIDATLNPPIQVFDMNDPAGDYMLNPSLARGNPADISVGSVNQPPAEITDASGTTFNTTTGEIVSLPPTAAELFRAQESQRAGGLDQRQAGYDAYQAMLNDAVGAAQSNIDAASSGIMGGPTRFMNQMFIDGMNTRIGGRDSDAYQAYLNDPRLFSPVYNQAGRLTGYRDQYNRLTGTDPISDMAAAGNDDSDDVVPPQTNPLTGAQQCPDGYIFDDFLQACRPKTRSEKNQNTGGSTGNDSGVFFRRTSLDDAPANLPTGFGFDAANRRFTESYGYRPDFYRSPMSLTGFTRVS